MGLEKTITFSVPVITTKNLAYTNETEELFAEAQKMALFCNKSYVRKTQEEWSNE